MKKFLIVLTSIAALVVTPILGQSIPRSYELQCAFNDGSRIAFKQHYSWNALAAMVPADVTSKKYTGYDVRFISKKGKKSDWLEIRNNHNDAFVSVYDISDTVAAQRLCSYQSMSLDDEYCYESVCLNKKGQWKEEQVKPPAFEWPREFFVTSLIAERPQPIGKELEKRQLAPDAVRVNAVAGVVFYEQSLFDISPQGKRKDGNLTITAVYQSQSKDGGKTWSNPVITTDSKIFELGKSPYAQTSAGYPYSYNGKRFDMQKPLK